MIPFFLCLFLIFLLLLGPVHLRPIRVFACMFVHHVCAMPAEARIEHQIPLNAVTDSCEFLYRGAGSQTGVLYKSSQYY